MYLLFVRCGDDKQLTGGAIEKKDGSKNQFTIMPGTVKKLEFELGDKVTCVHGSMTMIIHLDERRTVCALTMNKDYWMPNHEVTLDQAFIQKNQTEQFKLPLTGVNHRVHTGLVIR